MGYLFFSCAGGLGAPPGPRPLGAPAGAAGGPRRRAAGRRLLRGVLVAGGALAGPPHPADDLVAAERLGHPAALQHREHRLLDGGEPAAALGAGPAAAGGLAVVDLP